MKRNKISYHYYLSEPWGKAILFVALFFCFLNILYYIPWLDKMLASSMNIWQLLINAGLSLGITTGVICIVNKKTKKDTKVFSNERLIKRDDQLPDIKEKSGLYILTGESGCGKSTLLRDLFEHEENCLFMDKDYFLPWSEDLDFGGKRYVILDQFENALPFFDEDRKRIVEDLCSKDCLVILSFKEEVYGKVCKLFGDKIRNDHSSDDKNVFWLSLNENEKILLEREMNKTFNRKRGQSELFDDMLDSIRDNNMTLIRFSFLMKMIKDKGTEKADNNYLEFERDYDLLIKNYIKDVIDDYYYSQLAHQILYLLCLDANGIYSARLSDFRNITLASQEEIKSTLRALENDQLIQLHRKEEGYTNINEYEITHDYVFETIKNICQENIPIGFRKNIEYYHNNIQLKRTEVSSAISEETNEICEEFSGNKIEAKSSSKRAFRPIDIALIFMLFVIAAVNVALMMYYSGKTGERNILSYLDNLHFLNPYNNRHDAYLVLAFINVMVGLSIYYVYHYYKYFLRIFHHKPLKKESKNKTEIIKDYRFSKVVMLVMIIGCVGCISAFIFPNYWAIGLGVEILLNGCLSFMIIKHARSNESKRFISLGRNMLFSGAVVIFLGYKYHNYSEYSLFLAWPFFLLYAAFMFLCIVNHINRENTMTLVGTILFNTELYKKTNGNK